jgi:flagellar biosynthesis protein FlhF
MGELACSIPVADPLWSGTGRRMAFMGTHGAGKTSTMAKIAAEASCGQGLSVGLITVDAFRPGRAEQASCIAEDLGLPCMVAANREELEEALAAFEEMDLVLVDTWGLNPWQADAREAMDRLFEGMGLEKHLVVSGTWRPSELRELIACQSGMDSLVVTKVDEARGLTVVLAATWNSGYAVSHVCTGPELLGDIVAADGARIAREIMTRVA